MYEKIMALAMGGMKNAERTKRVRGGMHNLHFTFLLSVFLVTVITPCALAVYPPVLAMNKQ
jgi:cytochrome c biogenesis protein CcdA